MEKYLLIMLMVFSAVVIGDKCCKSKVVGGSTYTLKGEEDTSSYSCMDKCTYSKEGEGNSKYCFAAGDLQVECKDSTASITTAGAGGSDCKCGIKKTSRIVGGQETEVNEYPWMAAINVTLNGQDILWCGSTLIGDQWVVTASHCLFKNQDGTDPMLTSEISIVMGEHDITDATESKIPTKKVLVSKIITHENYTADNNDNDVALLKLAEAVDLNVYTPACVANTGDNFVGKNAWVYGWGSQSTGGVYPDKLLEVEVEIVSTEVCKLALGDDAITDGMLCAGGVEGKDSCQGDSGGPLTVDVSGQHTLVGDVSWGNGCGLDGQYGVYAKTAFYRNWIDTNIEANGGISYCPI